MSTQSAVRWSVNSAASEFGIDRRTLAKQLARAGVVMGADGKYSTQDICAAVFDEEWRERLREVKERADKLAIDNAKERRELIPANEVYAHFEGIFTALRSRILASGLPDEDKDEILNDLKSDVALGESPAVEAADSTTEA